MHFIIFISVIFVTVLFTAGLRDVPVACGRGGAGAAGGQAGASAGPWRALGYGHPHGAQPGPHPRRREGPGGDSGHARG